MCVRRPYPLVCRAASPEDLEGWVEALGHVGEGVRSNRMRCSGGGGGGGGGGGAAAAALWQEEGQVQGA